VKAVHARPAGLAGMLMLVICLASLTVGVIGLVLISTRP
jgi:hypothetical protein